LVTASSLPANQSGEIVLHSELQQFPFRADSNGNVHLYVTVPRDAGIGGHTIQVCWASSCHLTAVLTVLEPALISPSPSPGATGSPSPSPGATSSPPPSPTSLLSPYISVPAISKTGGFTVTFYNFGGGTWIVDVIQGGKAYEAGTANVTPGGTYSRSFATPLYVVAVADAYVLVRPNTGGTSFRSATVRVGA
jgi:hypothetical protein